jgi:hypothetical protein
MEKFKITLEVDWTQYSNDGPVILRNENGDRYGSKSEEFVDFLHSLKPPKEEVKELPGETVKGQVRAIMDEFKDRLLMEVFNSEDQAGDKLTVVEWSDLEQNFNDMMERYSALSPDPSNTIEIDGEEMQRQFSDDKIEKMADEFLPNYLDLDTFKPKEIEFLKMAWWQGATVMQNKLNVSTKEKDSKGEELVEALEGQLEWLKEITELMAGALVVDHFTYRISELEALLTNLNKQP